MPGLHERNSMTGCLLGFGMISSVIPVAGISHTCASRSRHAHPCIERNFWVRRQRRTACRSRDRRRTCRACQLKRRQHARRASKVRPHRQSQLSPRVYNRALCGDDYTLTLPTHLVNMLTAESAPGSAAPFLFSAPARPLFAASKCTVVARCRTITCGPPTAIHSITHHTRLMSPPGKLWGAHPPQWHTARPLNFIR